jgi:hypothetical protein
VAWCRIGDESSEIRLVLWDSLAEMLESLELDAVVKVENGFAQKGMDDELELHANWSSRVLLNPRDAGSMAKEEMPLKEFGELVEGEKARVKAILENAEVGERVAKAVFKDGVEAELSGENAFKLLKVGSLAKDVSCSTVWKLKKKELIGETYLLTGRMENRVFKVEEVVVRG